MWKYQDWLDDFADNLNRIMKQKGFTQSKLSEKTGLKPLTIRRYLNGEQEPTLQSLFNMANVLGCYYDDLIDNTEYIE